jgi:RNA polymerase sigma factor (sigma-70 family)
MTNVKGCKSTPKTGGGSSWDVAYAMGEHERLVHWVVRRQWRGSLAYGEAVQAGREGLWHAVEGYDAERGTRFSSYAVPAIARAVWRAVRRARQATQCCEERLSVAWAADEVDVAADVEAEWVAWLLRLLVSRLPERQRTVIEAHYGLCGEQPQSLAAIGRRLGVTRQRAQQLHAAALLELADPATSVALRGKLECNRVADYQAYLACRRAWQRGQRRRS